MDTYLKTGQKLKLNLISMTVYKLCIQCGQIQPDNVDKHFTEIILKAVSY